MDKRKKYEIGDHIDWTTDIDCVKVIDRNTRHLIVISYPEAALWDLVQQKYRVDQMIAMMSAITRQSTSNVENLISGTIREWQREGLIK